MASNIIQGSPACPPPTWICNLMPWPSDVGHYSLIQIPYRNTPAMYTSSMPSPTTAPRICTLQWCDDYIFLHHMSLIGIRYSVYPIYKICSLDPPGKFRWKLSPSISKDFEPSGRLNSSPGASRELQIFFRVKARTTLPHLSLTHIPEPH